MKYFIVGKTAEDELTLETFEAEDAEAALLYVVNSRNGFSKDEGYQKRKNVSFRDIGEYLTDINVSDEVTDLALFSEADVSEFGKGGPRKPVWSIFDYVNARHVF